MVYLALFLLFALPAALGISVLAALNAGRERVTLIVMGAVGGLAFFITGAYLLATVTPLTPALLLTLILATTLALAAVLTKTEAGKNWHGYPTDRTALIVLLLMVGLFSLITSKLFFMNEAGGLSTGVVSAFGDLGWHVANITTLQENRAFIPDDPIIAGEQLTYPPLTNFFSAMLLTANANLVQSVVMPALLLIPITLTLLYCYVRDVTRLRKAGVIALVLFLFSGGTVGWLYLADDWKTSNESLLLFLSDPPRHYTGTTDPDNQLNFLSPIRTMLLPQRPFIFGMPLAFTLLILLTPAKKTPPRSVFAAAGVIAGLVPLFHAHTALALVPAILALMWVQPTKNWFFFCVFALGIGIPSLLYYGSGIDQPGTFFTYKLGWMSAPDNWFVYWFKNTGLALPITVLGLLAPAPKTLKALALAGLLLFLAGNIWLVAVWEWDNTKIFVYWLLFTLPVITWFATKQLRHSSPLVRGVTIAFIAFHVPAGAIDVLQLTLPTTPSWEIWDASGIAMAQDIRNLTQPDEAILTAPIHNSPVALAGRSIYLGYPGHVWSHGNAYWQREDATEEFLTGQRADLPEATPQYILIGPAEREMYPLLQIQPDWRLLAQRGRHSLYALSSQDR